MTDLDLATSNFSMWGSSYDKQSLDELRSMVRRFRPGDLAKQERPSTSISSFPEVINILTVGAAGAGKSSYINSLLSIFNAAEVSQTHSELGTEIMTGTMRLEGPYELNDSVKSQASCPRTILQLWTTMGVLSTNTGSGSELEKLFLGMIKKCFLAKLRPGDFTGLRRQQSPLVKLIDKKSNKQFRVQSDTHVPYHLVLIMARYGVQSDADLATRLYCFLAKNNNIPALVVVTHSKDHVKWDSLSAVDPSALFFVENYLPNEEMQDEKSKRLLLPLLEAIKRVERSDVYWSRSSEDWTTSLKKSIAEYLEKMGKPGPSQDVDTSEDEEEEDELSEIKSQRELVLPAAKIALPNVMCFAIVLLAIVICFISGIASRY